MVNLITGIGHFPSWEVGGFSLVDDLQFSLDPIDFLPPFLTRGLDNGIGGWGRLSLSLFGGDDTSPSFTLLDAASRLGTWWDTRIVTDPLLSDLEKQMLLGGGFLFNQLSSPVPQPA